MPSYSSSYQGGGGYSQSSGGGSGSSSGTSSGSSNAQSLSNSFLLQSPQSAYSQLLAQQAAKLGKNQYDWATQNYNNLQGTANNAIGQYLQAGQMAKQLGTGQLQQYEQMYQPANAQFNQLASTYASAPRTAMNMGEAEAGATQAAATSWADTQKQLQASGIDISSGEYAGLRAAANTAAGASAAGAGQQARQNTEAQGRQLQQQNVTFGQSQPASALNALNTEFGANSGAVNTGESTVNTGVNALGSANQFYGSAGSALKLPSVGTQSESTSGSAQASTSTSSNASSQTSGSGNHSSGGSYSASYAGGGPVHAPQMHAPTLHAKDESKPQAIHLPHPSQDKPHMGGAQHLGAPHDGKGRQSGGGKETTAVPGDGQGPPPGGGAQGAPSAAPQGAIPAPVGQGPPGQVSAPAQPATPPAPGQTDTAPPPIDAGGFAKGGGIPDHYHIHGLPDAVSGGHIPYGISPSHGHTTDDVVANLNAGEFVIPRDITHHYGNKFFYDLINKGRKEGHKMSGETRGMPKADKGSSQNFNMGGAI